MLLRKFIGTAGTLGLVAAASLALAAPAQASHQSTEEAGGQSSTCEGLEFTVRPNPYTVRAWRAVLDGEVVWRSGDWTDEDLSTFSHEQLVSKGWTKDGPFTVTVPATEFTYGKRTVTLQWWHVNPPENPNGWTDWAGGAWTWEPPGHCPKLVKPKAPESEGATCEKEKGVIDIPAVKGVQYRIDGEKAKPGEHWRKPGTYLVTAEPMTGFAFPRYADDRWTVEVTAPKDCPGTGGEDEKKDDEKKDDVLPVTGFSTGTVAAVAAGLLVLGGAAYLLARQRRIRFTA